MKSNHTGRDALLAGVSLAAVLGLSSAMAEPLHIKGVYTVECRSADGRLRWADTIENTVTTVGKNLILDQALAGSAYTAAEFMGLISSASYSSISAADTMASHAGWLEAGSANPPTFSGNRGSAAWSAASAGAKALSSSLSFSITGTGTIKGAFLVGGSGATNVVAATTGVLISAGLFTGGDRSVLSGDSVSCSYSMSI